MGRSIAIIAPACWTLGISCGVDETPHSFAPPDALLGCSALWIQPNKSVTCEFENHKPILALRHGKWTELPKTRGGEMDCHPVLCQLMSYSAHAQKLHDALGGLSAKSDHDRQQVEAALRQLGFGARDGSDGDRARFHALLGKLDFSDLSGSRSESARTHFQESARTHFQEAARAAEIAGLWSEQIVNTLLLVHILLEHDDNPEGARELLDSISPNDAQPESRFYFEGYAGVKYYRARLAQKTGDLQTALRDSAELIAICKGIPGKLPRICDAPNYIEAEASLTLGQDDRAIAIFERLYRTSADCERAKQAANLGWAYVISRRTGASKYLNEALESFKKDVCPRKHWETVNVYDSLTLLALHDNDKTAAEQYFNAGNQILLERLPTDKVLKQSYLDLLGKLQLADGEYSEALNTYDRLLREYGIDRTARWRAVIGRARSLAGAALAQRSTDTPAQRKKKMRQVLEEYSAADSLSTILVDKGRAIAAHEDRLARQEVAKFLFEVEAHREAIDFLRRSQARVLEVLRRDWAPRPEGRVAAIEKSLSERQQSLRASYALIETLPESARIQERAKLVRTAQDVRASIADLTFRPDLIDARREIELSEPGAGEVYVLFEQIGSDFFVFATTGRLSAGQKVTRETLKSSAMEFGGLSNLAHLIAPARQIRILTPSDVNFHHGTFGDRVVSYAVGLPRAPAASRTRSPNVAFIAYDQAADTLDEGREVNSMLTAGSRPWTVQSAARVDMPSREGLSNILSEVSLFHYVGNASSTNESLPLLEETGFGVGEILLLKNAPDIVVLSGSPTVRPRDSVTFGVVEAFLAAGAQVVVAATAPVDPRTSKLFSQAFYTNLKKQRNKNAPLALHLAGREVADRRDAYAFRAFVR